MKSVWIFNFYRTQWRIPDYQNCDSAKKSRYVIFTNRLKKYYEYLSLWGLWGLWRLFDCKLIKVKFNSKFYSWIKYGVW